MTSMDAPVLAGVVVGITEEYLLRRLLAWSADPVRWTGEQSGERGPYSVMGRRPGALVDAGRIARSAAEAKLGALFRAVCDAEDVSITDVSRKSGIPVGRIAEIISGSDPTDSESDMLKVGLESAIKAVKP